MTPKYTFFFFFTSNVNIVYMHTYSLKICNSKNPIQSLIFGPFDNSVFLA